MNKVLILGLFLIFYSCGPSQQELEAQNALAEKIKQRTEDSIAFVDKERQEKIELERIHNEKIEVGKALKRDRLNEIIKDLERELQRLNNSLTETNRIKLLRTYDEKQAQLDAIRVQIYEKEFLISNLKKQVSVTYLFESFSFQSTPEGTVRQIIKSAKTRKHSNLRHLIDPYGDFDNSAFDLCYAELLSVGFLNLWNAHFEKGRIIGSPKFKNNNSEATVEVAVGWNSDTIEKIDLVNRYGRWYIKNYRGDSFRLNSPGS